MPFELTEKEKVMECIKALSKIEGYTMSYEGMKRTNVLYDNIDLLMKYFEDKNKELNNRKFDYLHNSYCCNTYERLNHSNN